MADDSVQAVPLAARTGDLPVRVASALVMLAVLAAAIWQGGVWIDVLIWVVALACLVEFVRLVLRATRKPGVRAIAWLGGVAYIGFSAWGLSILTPYHLAGVLGVVIFTDTCAYFTGRTIGGPKIAPRISPSKTWAGLFGGMAGSAAWVVFFASVLHNRQGVPSLAQDYRLSVTEIVAWAAIGAMLAIAAQAGDFFESWLKRRAGVKDSSTLIPGHGGVFDRVDGILPVAIIVTLLGMFA